MPTTTTRTRNDRIRHAASCGATLTDLAAIHGLSITTVRNILRGRDIQGEVRAALAGGCDLYAAANRFHLSASAVRTIQANNRRVSRVDVPTGVQPLGDQRRFGVELEFFGVNRRDVENMIRAELPGWSVKSDCSVSGNGLELVSPPLRGQDGLEQTRKACAQLQALGARVDRSCGLHVHHEARDLGAEGLVRVLEAYAANQSLLNWLVAPSRRGETSYARPVSATDVAWRRDHGTDRTRYLALNLASFGRHGTVEFRQHQGTLNFRKVEAWIALGQGLMDAALTSTRVNASGVTGLLSQVVADEDARAYLTGRALQLGAPAATVVA